MNGLSWLIYLAEVVDTFGKMLGTALFISIFALMAASAAVVIGHVEEESVVGAFGKKLAKWTIGALFVGSIFFVITPSRQTVLLIAASEIGERVMTSDRVQGVIDPSVELLQTWIRQQTQSIQREIQQSTNR